ncbi:hypothetical protein [uncultured Polaribacter sp.]|uniref:hypothetical protein n=1 Tax=uncultured Polaribacter sp. TaxID=174711 RepID=UPI0030D8A9C7|tara:strand:- start:1738 stop:2079 length:342 start_codon:yes stop_codon:yes gene_type:complete
MLGLVLLYWIGKYYYKLAEEYSKSKWGFTILGILSYYGGTIVFGFLFVIIAEIISPGYVDDFNDSLLGLLALPFGALACYGLYKYLEKTWIKEDPRNKNSIDEIGKSQEKLEA